MMNKEDIKTKILSKNDKNKKYFIDNAYLDLYCELISNNIETKRETLVTQIHHVIPLCLYRKLYEIKEKNWRRIAEKFSNEDENIKVNLKYKDHILAHFYLVMFSTDILYYNLFNALDWQLRLNPSTHIRNKKEDIQKIINELNLDNYQELYENFKQTERIQVKCIETQEVFKSMKDVFLRFNKKLRLKESFENPFKTAEGYHWIKFGDNETEELLSEFVGKAPNKQNDYKEKNTKKVICIETQEIFNTVFEASKKYFNDPWGVDAVKGFTKGYHWAYLDDLKRQEELKEFIGKDKETPEETKARLSKLQKTRYHRKLTTDEIENIKKRTCKKIICIETGIIYKSISEAYNLNKEYKVTCGGISTCCKHKDKIRSSGGYHWAYAEDKIRQEELEEFVGKPRCVLRPQELANKAGILVTSKPVICIETQQIFSSASQAASYLGVKNIYVNQGYEYSHGYHWAFVEDLETQEKFKDFIGKNRLETRPASLKNSKKVLCVELNLIFDNARRAAEYFNIESSSISNICCGRRKNKMYAGYTWKYLN